MPITTPTLLFNDECGVCRRIAHWVQKSAQESSIVVRPIGDDPVALHELAPTLDIWDAYETIHLLMPDGSMKLGGEAVAEVLRRVPSTRWFARMFSVRPFQLILNLCYLILSDVRPLFGCESCGTPSLWVRPFAAMKRWVVAIVHKHPVAQPGHSTPIEILRHRTRESSA